MKKQPVGKIERKELITHGHTRIDNYFWMNRRDSKEVLRYIDKENKNTTRYFKELNPLKKSLLKEFENRINPNDVSSPFNMNGVTYQERSQAGKDYNLIYSIEDKKDFLFFDENERAKDQSFYSLAEWSPSPNNELLAISEDYIGRRNYTIKIRVNKTGSYLDDSIEETDGSIIWANDNETVFYVKKDPETLREFQVYRHQLGSETTNDILVYEEKDERFSVFITKSLTNKYIEIHSQSSTTSETMLIDADSPSTFFEVFLKRKNGHIYSAEHHQNGFYIVSNDKAKNNKLVFTKKFPKDISECETISIHNKNTLLENALVLHNFILLEERTNGLQKIRIIELKSKKESSISFDEETYYLGLSINDDYHSNYIYFTYNSLTTPSSVFKYDLKKHSREIYFRKELLDKKFDSNNYESKRIFATANDGTKIAVSLIYKKDTILEQAPLLLYGYGSYGITIPDVFSATRLSLIERGFVYAIAHIRGEKYLGKQWYEDGKFLKKKNTFTDFINCAEMLGTQGYCDPKRIYAQGGSAGGLLMGAVANLAPYLWKGIIAQVPFVDVVTTMLDESIPLTIGEYEEWGNPKEEEYYYYMLSYSPYDNVKEMNYPAMYITTGYHDSQVQYWEPLKWVAKMRALRTNNNPLLFDCNMDAGHGGGSGRTNEREEIAKEFAFILHLEGIYK
jgi:oligopeptidase B